MTNATPSSTSAITPNVVANIRLTLKYLFGLVPIVAGLDKFTNLLADWPAYLSPHLTALTPFSPATFMHIVGVIEIAVGVLVFVKTRLGAGIVTLWLIAIALQLVLQGQALDVAVRDIVIAVGGSWTLYRLTPVAKTE